MLNTTVDCGGMLMFHFKSIDWWNPSSTLDIIFTAINYFNHNFADGDDDYYYYHEYITWNLISWYKSLLQQSRGNVNDTVFDYNYYCNS